MRRFAVPAALALLLAACSSPSAPLTAGQMARKIPGAHGCYANTPGVLAIADETCYTPGGGTVDVITFTSGGDEVRWIQAQGAYHGCCVQGRLWAATFSSAVPVDGFAPVIRALGGRQVSG
jgi:hypothetical protein